MTCRIHAIEPASRANGPGLRSVVWFQGCSLACPGCFNPSTHDPQAGLESTTETVWGQLSGSGVEGVSFSGGEPLQQPDALLDLARRARQAGLSVLIFSGYTREAIERLPLGREILGVTDVLIAGPYREGQPGRGLLGSANQRIHLLTNRYSPAGMGSVPRGEIILHRDGCMTISGVAPPAVR
jgi:anaerobic ribonucleoside-triphosphate reductase activating protein